MMPLVPTTLVRITRFYLLTAIGYLVLTLALAVASAGSGSLPAINPNLFWYVGVLGWVALPVILLAFILLGRNLTLSKVTLTLRFFVAAVVYFLAGVTVLTLINLGLAPLGRPL